MEEEESVKGQGDASNLEPPDLPTPNGTHTQANGLHVSMATHGPKSSTVRLSNPRAKWQWALSHAAESSLGHPSGETKPA